MAWRADEHSVHFVHRDRALAVNGDLFVLQFLVQDEVFTGQFAHQLQQLRQLVRLFFKAIDRLAAVALSF